MFRGKKYKLIKQQLTYLPVLKPSLNTDQPVCIIATTLTFKQYAAEIEKKTLAPGLAREIFHRDVPPGAKFQFIYGDVYTMFMGIQY